jgi:hypothetical protein
MFEWVQLSPPPILVQFYKKLAHTSMFEANCRVGATYINEDKRILSMYDSQTESIETLGMKENNEMKLYCEIIVKEGAPELSDNEKEVMCSAFQGELYDDMLDSDIVMLLGEPILAKRRKVIEKGVRDLNEYNEFDPTFRFLILRVFPGDCLQVDLL